MQIQVSPVLNVKAAVSCDTDNVEEGVGKRPILVVIAGYILLLWWRQGWRPEGIRARGWRGWPHLHIPLPGDKGVALAGDAGARKDVAREARHFAKLHQARSVKVGEVRALHPYQAHLMRNPRPPFLPKATFLADEKHLLIHLEGVRLEALEICKSFFSKSNVLASTTRYASCFHCKQAITTYLKHTDTFETYHGLCESFISC
jgi:hypothetical protein